MFIYFLSFMIKRLIWFFCCVLFVGYSSAYISHIGWMVAGKSISLIKVIPDTTHTLITVRSQSWTTLSNLVSSVGGIAGVNGAYFCPASYLACWGKNTSDANVIVSWKAYFSYGLDLGARWMFGINSSWNIEFVLNNLWYVSWITKNFNVLWLAKIQYWIANFPVLALSGKNVLGESSSLLDIKMKTRSRKSFICVKKDLKTIVMWSVGSITMDEFAPYIIANFSCFHAINLDAWGSLWMIYDKKVIMKPGRFIMDAFVVIKKK